MITLQDVLQSIILLIPEYIANGSPPVISKILGRCTPIDLYRNFVDGRRIFGDGKTIEGFILGVLSGYGFTTLIYGILLLLFPNLKTTFKIPTAIDVLILCTLALLGDLLGAFIKRRLGLPRGAPAPILDQLDFLIFPLLYMYFNLRITSTGVYIFAVVFTIVMHLFTNFVAYLLKIKREPW